jgi:hypothetical protein
LQQSTVDNFTKLVSDLAVGDSKMIAAPIIIENDPVVYPEFEYIDGWGTPTDSSNEQ